MFRGNFKMQFKFTMKEETLLNLMIWIIKKMYQLMI